MTGESLLAVDRDSANFERLRELNGFGDSTMTGDIPIKPEFVGSHAYPLICPPLGWVSSFPSNIPIPLVDKTVDKNQQAMDDLFKQERPPDLTDAEY
jgi:hypothetical protein